jgi:hypothetical protein
MQDASWAVETRPDHTKLDRDRDRGGEARLRTEDPSIFHRIKLDKKREEEWNNVRKLDNKRESLVLVLPCLGLAYPSLTPTAHGLLTYQHT